MRDHLARRRRQEPGRIAGQFVFVSRSPDAAEDDGWLIGLMIDAGGAHHRAGYTGCLELGSTAVASIRIPHRVPPGIHGAWLK